MYKTIGFVLLLITLSVSIQVHLPQTTSPSPAKNKPKATPKAPAKAPAKPPTPPSDSQNPFGNDPEAGAAMERLMKFVMSDPKIFESLSSGKEPQGQVLKKFINFMINDKFFQKQLIKSIEEDPKNAWFKKLSLDAKVRFLRIITKYDQKQLESPKTQKQLVKTLLKDKQLGSALKAQFGNDVDASKFASAFSSVNKASKIKHSEISQMLEQ